MRKALSRLLILTLLAFALYLIARHPDSAATFVHTLTRGHTHHR